MTCTTPILKSPIPFDATKNYNFEFTVIGGDQIVGSNLVIQKVSDNTVIYNQDIDSFAFFQTINANALTNNIQYKAQVRTRNASGVYSSFSDWVLFYCYEPATIDITNLTNGIANNQNFLFTGSYTQPNDPIKNHLFILYDSNMTQLGVSPLSYSSTIEYMFTLENQKNYYIKLKCISQSGVVTEKTVGFLASYIAPTMGAELQLTNLYDTGMVDMSIIAVQIDGVGTNYTFENEDWVNLKGLNASVIFTECFDDIAGAYIIKLFFKDIIDDNIFLSIKTKDGIITLKYYDKRFHAFKKSASTKLVSHFVNNNDITFEPTDKICVELKMIKNLIDIYAELY